MQPLYREGKQAKRTSTLLTHTTSDLDGRSIRSVLFVNWSERHDSQLTPRTEFAILPGLLFILTFCCCLHLDDLNLGVDGLSGLWNSLMNKSALATLLPHEAMSFQKDSWNASLASLASLGRRARCARLIKGDFERIDWPHR